MDLDKKTFYTPLPEELTSSTPNPNNQGKSSAFIRMMLFSFFGTSVILVLVLSISQILLPILYSNNKTSMPTREIAPSTLRQMNTSPIITRPKNQTEFSKNSSESNRKIIKNFSEFSEMEKASYICGDPIICQPNKFRNAIRLDDLRGFLLGIELYNENNNRFPDKLENLIDGYLRKIKTDPLTNENYFYQLQNNGKDFLLCINLEIVGQFCANHASSK